MEEYDLSMETRSAVTLHSGEIICCPKCDDAELVMQTTELRHGIVLGFSGMFADYYCRKCDTMLTLAFFNQPLGEDKIAARINWVVSKVD